MKWVINQALKQQKLAESRLNHCFSICSEILSRDDNIYSDSFGPLFFTTLSRNLLPVIERCLAEH